MNIDSEIRTTMRHVADGAEAPVIDETGFVRRVRRHRTRRRASIAGATAAVAALALAVPLTVSQIGSGPGSEPAPFAAVGPQERPPAYFVLGGRAVMLDTAGKLHDLDVRAESIVGPTEQGVLIVSRESRLIHVRVSETGGGWRFDRVGVPTKQQPIQSAAVSSDGSQVAVVDLEERLVIYDLGSGDELSRTSPGPSAYVTDFGDQALYAFGDGSLRLGVGADAIEIPVFQGDDGWTSAAGGDVVAVTDDGTTRIYDVTGGSAVEIAELHGGGDLSPNGRYYLAGQTVWDLEAGEHRQWTGLEGNPLPMQTRWLDSDTALVATYALRQNETVTLLNACAASTQQCQEVYDAGTSNVWITP